MIENILIAAAVKPIKGKTFTDVYNEIGKAAPDYNCVVRGGLWTSGPGCTNLGLKIESDNQKSIDAFGHAICLALMPAKWGSCADEIADGFICDLDKPIYKGKNFSIDSNGNMVT